ncbi:BaiN/RdsA family NAD(P)/FAD-dependent oxidoreductase [Anaeromicrobium sediminis]|uniref:Aminoacetone oxidase family FAD-binding enzyme n=1 Tax=Anaeromicrobium sediminis TaxID=1478221 RepID=A0A267MR16_9FIRM|nr:NAD(P)/FAD-dependent oxidoreductase [Anaeromicrobium sediminis]PAB61170.1 aminoacetone oxidase family FAD-binding enzyme [Anaeromicrobium sediminis]
MSKVIVIGGGAAGMIAAATSASKGNETVLLEQNEKLGKKIYITGKGRCNITNAQDVEELINNVTTNKNFLYSAFYSYTNDDIINLMHEHGVKTKVERGFRVFPVSDKSSDVIKALEKNMSKYKVDVRLDTKVKDIIVKDNKVTGVILSDNKKINCEKIIIATGGLSYPTTGATGDGYNFAKKVGHNVVKLKAALIPLETKEGWIKELQGLSLRNVEIKFHHKNKVVYSNFGEMLFTHFGISGPLVLSASNYINEYLEKGNMAVTINLKPALDRDKLDKRIQRDFEKYSNKQFKNALKDLLPAKLIPVIIKLSNIEEEKTVNQITKEERKNLLDNITKLPMTVTKTRPIKEAIITSGGINVKEIDPSTMESKKTSGLYFAGEVIDVEALTGGYNLQIAYSTGYLAGMNV